MKSGIDRNGDLQEYVPIMLLIPKNGPVNPDPQTLGESLLSKRIRWPDEPLSAVHDRMMEEQI